MPDAPTTTSAPTTTDQAPTVATHHRDYDRFHGLWQKCRDCVEGEEAVKARGPVYLPVLNDSDDSEYAAYKARAEFFGAAYRTVQGLAGTVTRKPADVKWPASIDELRDRLGNNGESLELLANITLEEVLTTGRIGLYVDAAEGENSEPYVTTYCPEKIINWRSYPDPADGRQVFTLIVLQEDAEEEQPDGFSVEIVERYRVLRLVPGPEPVYQVEVYDKTETKVDGKTVTLYVRQSSVEPRMRGGKRFSEIPFVFIGPSGITGRVEKSPILDLVNTNLSHYRTSADLEHGRHWVALPTPYATGYRSEGKVKVGPSSFLYTEDSGGKFGMLEFSGAGLQSLERAQDQKEKRMAILGARLLEGQKTQGVEAAETVRLRSAGEHSVLSNVAMSVSEGLTKAMQWVCQWMAAAGDASIALSEDFNATTLDAPTMSALLMAYIQGAISYETYIYNLSRGEILPDGVDAEKERELIAAGGPVMPPKQLTEEEDLGGSKPPKPRMTGGEGIGAVA